MGINTWIYDTDQKIDKALAPVYRFLEKALQWADPCPNENMACGVAFPIGPVGAAEAAVGMAAADSVIAETFAAVGKGGITDITSSTILTADEALAGAEKFLGPGYKEMG